MNIFLIISFNIFFGWSKEPSHGDECFEYLQYIFGREIRNLILNYEYLSGGM